jgi:hypothetical protein
VNRPLLSLFAVAVVAGLPAVARAQAGAPDSAQSVARAAAVASTFEAGGEAAGAPVRAMLRPLAAGDVVRLLSPAGRYVGTLTQVTADTFTLAAPGRQDAVPRSGVTQMHRLVNRGSRGKSILHGAGVGLLAGTALGFVVGSTMAHCDDCESGRDGTAQAAFSADGAVLGALVGAMLGPTFRRTRWERVDAAPVPPLQTPAAQAESASGPSSR